MTKNKNGILLPCEYAVKSVIPSIRASIARVLVEDFKMSRYSAAKVLRTSPAAITNYLEKRRGDRYVDTILGSEELRRLVIKSAEKLIIIHEKEGREAYIEYQKALCMICSRVNEVAIEMGCPATIHGRGNEGEG